MRRIDVPSPAALPTVGLALSRVHAGEGGGRQSFGDRRVRAWIVCFALLISPHHVFAESAEDPKIARSFADINHSSENGDFDMVQTLRMKLADYAAGIGRY